MDRGSESEQKVTEPKSEKINQLVHTFTANVDEMLIPAIDPNDSTGNRLLNPLADYSEVEIPSVPNITSETEQGNIIYTRLLDFLNRSGVAVNMVDGEGGAAYHHREKTMDIPIGHQGDRRTHSVLHETAHYVTFQEVDKFWDREGSRVTKTISETVAEGTAHTVMGFVGVDTSHRSVPYAAHHILLGGQRRDILLKSVPIVTTAAQRLVHELNLADLGK